MSQQFNTVTRQHFPTIRTRFAWFPTQVFRSVEHLTAATGTWVWLQLVEVQTVPDINANRFFSRAAPDIKSIVLCGRGRNPGLLPIGDDTASYSTPERKRLLVANRVIWESKKP